MQAFHWKDIPTAFDPERINRHFAALESGITTELIASGARPDGIAIQRFADLRFRMQSKGLAVPVEPGQLTATSITRLMDRFVEQFTELFGKEAVFKGAGAELLSLRVQARGAMDRPRTARVMSARSGDGHVPSSRPLYLGPKLGEALVDVVRGAALCPGDRVHGPAVIEHPGTTIFVGPGQTAAIDDFENTVIELRGA
jgi:N-methylhydantoinase A